MGIARSTYYAEAATKAADTEIIDEMKAICDEFEAYGYRRVDAELRHRGYVVNSKKVRRLMREHDLNPRRKRRFVVTTDSNHDGPVFANIARGFEVHGPDQLWVSDITPDRGPGQALHRDRGGVRLSRARQCHSDHVWMAPAAQGLCWGLASGRSRPCIRRLRCGMGSPRALMNVRVCPGPNQWRAL